MTPNEFADKFDKVRPLVRGHGREIARESGYSYTTYFNVLRGLVTDPEKIEKVWKAVKAKADQLVAQVNDL